MSRSPNRAGAQLQEPLDPPRRAPKVYSFDQQASAAADLPAVECRFRYIVCSMQRTGSSLLCHALADTGLAGLPREYLHPRMVNAMLARFERPSMPLGELMSFFERHRSTANGVFGVKVHLDQLRRVTNLEGGTARFLSRFDAAILIYRRDKLMQAISYERAIQTQFWEADQAAQVATARDRSVIYSAGEIAKHLAAFIEQETDWRRALAGSQCRVLPVAYEDLVSDFPGQMHAVAQFLGDPSLIGVAFDRPPLEKLSDDLNGEWAARFVAEIQGGQSPPG